MMLGTDWEIGRIFGIPIKVHMSWFLVFGFVTWSLATGYLPDMLPGLSPQRYWGMGGTAALLLFGSVLLHELGHSYVALRYQIPIQQITLFIFGGVAQMRREAPGPKAEFLIAIAGPLVSFALGGMLLGLAGTVNTGQGLIALGLLLGSVNLQLGLFNLIPGFPLDGGRGCGPVSGPGPAIITGRRSRPRWSARGSGWSSVCSAWRWCWARQPA
jgi:Zn-dependent protease